MSKHKANLTPDKIWSRTKSVTYHLLDSLMCSEFKMQFFLLCSFFSCDGSTPEVCLLYVLQPNTFYDQSFVTLTEDPGFPLAQEAKFLVKLTWTKALWEK